MTVDLAGGCGGLRPRPAIRELDDATIVVHQHPVVMIKATPSLLELHTGLIAELLEFSLDRCQLALNTGQSPIDVLQLVLHALDDSGDLRDRTEQGGSLLTIH